MVLMELFLPFPKPMTMLALIQASQVWLLACCSYLLACTGDDIGFSFTECILGKTDLHFFWDNDICTAGVSLPASKEDLDCRM
jgi:hypothetical protein